MSTEGGGSGSNPPPPDNSGSQDPPLGSVTADLTNLIAAAVNQALQQQQQQQAGTSSEAPAPLEYCVSTDAYGQAVLSKKDWPKQPYTGLNDAPALVELQGDRVHDLLREAGPRKKPALEEYKTLYSVLFHIDLIRDHLDTLLRVNPEIDAQLTRLLRQPVNHLAGVLQLGLRRLDTITINNSPDAPESLKALANLQADQENNPIPVRSAGALQLVDDFQKKTIFQTVNVSAKAFANELRNSYNDDPADPSPAPNPRKGGKGKNNNNKSK